MKLEGVGRIEQIVSDYQDRPRRMVVSAVVGGTPITITFDAGSRSCFVESLEQDRNIVVEVSQ